MAAAVASNRVDTGHAILASPLAAMSLAWCVRPALWGALCALTAALLLYPVDLTLAYSPVQSLKTIDNLPQFAALYYAWLATVMLLLWTLDGRGWRATGEGLGLVVIFSLVFTGFYLFHEPFPGLRAEGPKALALAQVLIEEGHLNNLALAVRLQEWPGVGLLVAPVALLTGQTVYDASGVVLIISSVLLPALMYLLFLSAIGRHRLACFGVLIFIQGNFIVAASLGMQGYYLGPLWFVTFLVILNSQRDTAWASSGNRIMGIILVTTTAITHFLSATLFAFVLISIGIVRWACRRSALQLQSAPLYIVISASWLLYWSVATFREVVLSVSQLMDDIAAGNGFFYLSSTTRVNVTGNPNLPVWVSLTRTLWMFVLLVPGSVVGLWWLVTLRHRRPAEQDTVAQLLGVGLFDTLSGAVSKGGFYLTRILWHAPFFTVPLMLAWLSGLRHRTLRLLLSGSIAFVFFTLSLPTFFAHHPTENTDTVHPAEFAAGQFLARNYRSGETLAVSGSHHLYIAVLMYWIPRAVQLSEDDVASSRSESVMWSNWFALVEDFLDQKSSPQSRLFVWSARNTWPYEHALGVPATHPYWGQLQDRLANGSDLIYDDGTTRMYEN